jgi:hypothetical protein
MQPIAATMNTEQIAAVAAYLSFFDVDSKIITSDVGASHSARKRAQLQRHAAGGS